MTTARNIITKAMQKAGILTKTESPSADEITDGLFSLNALISSWSNDSLIIYSRIKEVFPLTTGGPSYTIGPGATFNTARPLQIITAFVRQNNIDYPLNIVSDAFYENNVEYKTLQGIPDYLSYNNAYPIGTISIYPTPVSGYDLHIMSEKAMTEFDLDTDISLPSGWERAMVYNLAVEISPEYGQQVDPLTLKIANDSLGKIKMAVARTRPLDGKPVDRLAQYNINTGYYT